MKTICSFDNYACLFDNLPDTGSQLGLMFIVAVAVSVVFASFAYKRL